jgi:hypothetical protein
MAIDKVRVICCDVCSAFASKHLIGEEYNSVKDSRHELIKKGWTFIKIGCPCCDGDYCPECTKERVEVYGKN